MIEWWMYPASIVFLIGLGGLIYFGIRSVVRDTPPPNRQIPQPLCGPYCRDRNLTGGTLATSLPTRVKQSRTLTGDVITPVQHAHQSRLNQPLTIDGQARNAAPELYARVPGQLQSGGGHNLPPGERRGIPQELVSIKGVKHATKRSNLP
jgi:hypothetical protein